MNQLQATGYAYDATGNTVLRNGVTLAYDVNNHLTQLGSTFAAGYTGAGLRAWRTADGVTTYYLMILQALQDQQVSESWILP